MPCCFGMVASSKCLLCGAGLGHPPLSWVAPVAPGRDVLRLLLQYFFAEIFICLQAGSFRAVLRSGLCGSLRAVLVTRFGGGKVELLAILFVGAWVASMLLSERGHCMHTDLAGHLRRLLQWLVHCASMTACIGGGQKRPYRPPSALSAYHPYRLLSTSSGPYLPLSASIGR